MNALGNCRVREHEFAELRQMIGNHEGQVVFCNKADHQNGCHFDLRLEIRGFLNRFRMLVLLFLLVLLVWATGTSLVNFSGLKDEKYINIANTFLWNNKYMQYNQSKFQHIMGATLNVVHCIFSKISV